MAEKDTIIGSDEVIGRTIKSILHTPWRSSPRPPHETAEFYLLLDNGIWVDLNPWQSRLALRYAPSTEHLEWREDMPVPADVIEGTTIIGIDRKRVQLSSGMTIEVDLTYLGSEFFCE